MNRRRYGVAFSALLLPLVAIAAEIAPVATDKPPSLFGSSRRPSESGA